MNKNYCTIYLVRHGETDWNLKRLIQGQTDNPLNQTGIKQAEDLRTRLGNIKFDAFFSSDLMRAKQTAEIVALNHKLIVQTTKALRERRYGNFEGEGFQKLNEFYDQIEEVMKNGKVTQEEMYKQKGMETDEEVAARLMTFFRETAVANPGKIIFMGGHGGAMRIILSKLSGKVYRPGDIANTAYLEIKSDGVDFFIKSMYGVPNR